MGAGDVGIATTDFTSNALSDFGVSVTYEAVTKALDPITGEETLSYASGVSKTVVFIKRSQSYDTSREGIVDLGDAYCMAETSDGFKKDDLVTYNSEKFIILNVIRRRAGDVDFFDKCILKKYEE